MARPSPDRHHRRSRHHQAHSSQAAGIVTVRISGGTAGTTYRVACRITTSGGNITEWTRRSASAISTTAPQHAAGCPSKGRNLPEVGEMPKETIHHTKLLRPTTHPVVSVGWQADYEVTLSVAPVRPPEVGPEHTLTIMDALLADLGPMIRRSGPRRATTAGGAHRSPCTNAAGTPNWTEHN
ncbi:MAG: hypothetical protein IPL15_11510 [Comamonadaceae bacterium]|uniref:phage fiber-tail adaptor protein n=1 Tax=Candidatus Skiveiella danica TaxID=3386177 RepID=UPI00390B9976|nr:hypothetical protein [Comamonadaceae bacterium]